MEDTHTSDYSGGYTNLKRLLLLLCLAGVQSATVLITENGMSPNADDSENDELEVLIAGPDYVTVGVPCSFECEADCPSTSSCTYSMALDRQGAKGQGNVLAFTLPEWVETLTLTCTAKDDDRDRAGSITKKLQVLAGPANVSILGSDLMYTKDNSYSCHAHCRPSCNYTWRIDGGHWIGGPGNVITVTPKELDTSKTLTCKASNSVSGLFVSATRSLRVTSGPSEIKIEGPDYFEIGEKSKLSCVAQCIPSCRYLWFMDDQTVRGNEIEITVDHPVESLTVKCEAQNTVSRKSEVILKTLQLSGRSIATRAEQTSALLLCALVISL